jgi:hypothetical protein
MASTQRENAVPPGLYGTFAGALLAALVLVAVLAWPRGPTLLPVRDTTFQTDSPP